MMDERDVIEIVRRELDEREAARPPVSEYLQMMPVCEFAAQDDVGRPLRVMGVTCGTMECPNGSLPRMTPRGALVPEITACVWGGSGLGGSLTPPAS